MEYVVEMLNIRKEFPGIVANDNITLQLKEGEVHALLSLTKLTAQSEERYV